MRDRAVLIQAMVDPQLKKKAESVLQSLGITASQAISAMYAQVVLQRGLPFDVKIPASATPFEADEQQDCAQSKTSSNFDEMMEAIDS